MSFEGILLELEGPASVGRRDFKKYYFTVYGEPSDSSAWGLSIEGHHMSLNFTFAQGAIVDSTPQLFAIPTLPSCPRSSQRRASTRLGEKTPFPQGYRLIATEEDAGFALLNSLDDAQQSKAVFNEACPEDILWAGEPQPKPIPYVGISAKDLDTHQKALLRKAIESFLACQTKWLFRSDSMRLLPPMMTQSILDGPVAKRKKEPATSESRDQPLSLSFAISKLTPLGNKANHVHCVMERFDGGISIYPCSNSLLLLTLF